MPWPRGRCGCGPGSLSPCGELAGRPVDLGVGAQSACACGAAWVFRHKLENAMNHSEVLTPPTFDDALALQRKAYLAHPVPTLVERTADLRTLQRFIREHKDALCDAISADYGHRSRHETLLAEVFPAVDGIDHVITHLRGWMKPKHRLVDWRNFMGANNRVIAQPLGVVGVIVPRIGISTA